MKIYEVRISRSARTDMDNLRVSHNRRWIYVYHIEGTYVIVDRILPAKMNKG